MKGLSKSRYTLFSQCLKALWLRTYKADVAEKDEALQARFEKGNEVGDLAMGLFGNFKTRKPELYEKYIDGVTFYLDGI